MQQLHFFSHNRLKLVGVIVVLGLVLAMEQVRGSTPMTIAPQSLAAQIEAEQAPLRVDVRSPQEFAEGHIPGAINIPYRELPHRLDELAGFESRNVVLYCEVGVRAGVAQAVLEAADFQQVGMLEGHMQAWRQAELPIDKVLPVSTP